MSNQEAVGPHPSYIEIRKQFITEEKIQDFSDHARVNTAKEESMRLQGVSWIDNVRKVLRLPVRTFDTAVVSYHKFRLDHPDVDYNYVDAAAAALFIACKIEDTLKRSREILCAAYNLRVSISEHLPQDDPIFENGSKAAIGMERLVLEAIGFDFRSRVPQRLIVKLCKHFDMPKETIYRTAFDISIDLYRTFAPLKMTTMVMAIACVELSCRLHKVSLPDPESGRNGHKKYAARLIKLSKRSHIMETLLDLLDLYGQNHAITVVGQHFTIEDFIAVRLALNQESSTKGLQRYAHRPRKSSETNGEKANGDKSRSSTSARQRHSRDSKPDARSPQEANGEDRSGPGRGRAGMKEGTLRYMLDASRAEEEQQLVDTFFKDEYEEHEVEEEVRNDRRR